jgi:hypothetical protein
VIVNISIKQIDPITSNIAKVQIHFEVQGPLPDVVQILYSQTDTDPSPAKKDVEMQPPENKYDIILDIAAGAFYYFRFCPRTVKNGTYVELIDGESWETFCAVYPRFTTMSHENIPIEVPQITSLVSFPKTFKKLSSIKVEWSSSGNKRCNLKWKESYFPDQPRYWMVFDGHSPHFVFPVKSSTKYHFKIQDPNTSAWSALKEVETVPPLGSIRQFFEEVDISNGIRSYLPGENGSLKDLMEY